MKTEVLETQNKTKMFTVFINQFEYMKYTENNSLFYQFRAHILSKLGSMIAAYYFKHHRDELVEFIKSGEVKEMIAKELASRLILELEEKKK